MVGTSRDLLSGCAVPHFKCHDYSRVKPEQRTRQEKIDLQLGRAGWSVGSRRLIEEYLVASSSLKDTETPYKTRNEFADYALAGRLEQVLGIVEAKRSSRHPLEGERQAADYADAILANTGTDPFIFLAIADESHRTIYSRYKAILDHFDAIKLGLTATPADFIDHWDNFDYFQVNKDGRTGAVSEPLPSQHLAA